MSVESNTATAKRYAVILADPPWEYNVYNGKSGPVRKGRAGMRGVADRHYRTLAFPQIQALPIPDLAARDAALFLWATPPCLPLALSLLETWGFKYRTFAFTWVKMTKAGVPCTGLGHYTRANAEVCLLGIRGRMERRARDVPQVLLAPRREHSRKPDEQYQRIMRLFDGPYLELFARQQWPGWDVWGNEAGRFPAQPFLWSEGVAI